MIVVPVLEPGAIAVVTRDDTLSFLRFHSEQVEQTEIAREYVGQVAGGELSPVVPALLEGACVYLQSRRLIVYSFAEQRARTYRMTGELEEMPIAAAWVSTKPPVIVACQQDTTRYDSGRGLDYRLRTFALREGAAVPLGVRELGSVDTSVARWTAGRGIVAVFDEEKVSFWAPDLTEELDHPLARALRALLGPGRSLRDLRLHPLRDEAVLLLSEGESEETSVMSVLRAVWRGEEVEIVPLAEGLPGDAPRLGTFSPCGAWIAYDVEASTCVAIYVHHLDDPEQPPPPIFLGLTASANAVCWTREPTALLVFDANLEEIARWDLAALSSLRAGG